MRARVKICGLTNADDAVLAIELGADALGFVFWPKSPRFVRPADAAGITMRLPPFVTRVGVFVGSSPPEVADIVRHAGLDVAQLHGIHDPTAYTDSASRLVRATSLPSEGDLEIVANWPSAVMPIVDAHDPARHGGTGQKAHWERATALASRRQIILAGGLTAENVGDAIRIVQPWAVDVSSGVEASPGRKSPERLRAFMAAVAASQGADW